MPSEDFKLASDCRSESELPDCCSFEFVPLDDPFKCLKVSAVHFVCRKSAAFCGIFKKYSAVYEPKNEG